MKAILYLLSVCTAIFFVSSCGKTSGPQATVASGAQWKLNGKSYSGKVDTVSDNQLIGSDGTNSIQLFFPKLPVAASSSFAVVNEYNAAAASLSAGQCAFEINIGTDDVYLSKSTVSDSISVTYSSGKYFAISFFTYKMDHYKAAGDFVDSTSTCTLVSLKQ